LSYVIDPKYKVLLSAHPYSTLNQYLTNAMGKCGK